jgi:RES domain
MLNYLAKKIPGKLNEPPPETEFNQLEIAKFCRPKSGILYRLHSTDFSTGRPWEPVLFSRRGATRFDPTDGVGTLYIAKSLAGAVLEIFDDRWGPVGSIDRYRSATPCPKTPAARRYRSLLGV